MTHTFSTLGVAEPLLRALAAENYLTPTPIQAEAIPLVLSGRDVLGLAQTGTGKTAAFALPILQKLAETATQAGPRCARALILAPTRELAIQIDQSFKTYGRHLNLRRAVILGGVNQNKQVAALKHGVDVLVATPGRLLDLVNQRHVQLNTVGLLVIDEADRMFDMGFIRDVRKIVGHLPKKRQSLLFSATMPDEVAHLVQEILHEPARVAVTPKVVTAEKVEQRVYFVEQQGKRGLLHDLLRDPEMKRVIVFTRTKHGANKVADQIGKAGHAADAIHGNKSQGARQRALENFRSGRCRVLVATDIAARGIDIDDITHVVNFELPNVAESYVHRIGRTARAGSGGIAISFCDPTERAFLRDIEKLIRQPLKAMNEGGRPLEQVAQPKREIDYAKRRPRHKKRRPQHRGNAQRAA
ncbi:MAG TPA: DEAD/DEAH box helicase [Rhizomicrobium sp.]|nr:DEAD/DEAH box helicase [Rhizomicrobium sp.]